MPSPEQQPGNRWLKEPVYQATFTITGQELRPAAPLRVDDPIRGQRLNHGLFSSLTPEWPTPAGVFAALDERYYYSGNRTELLSRHRPR